MKNAQSAKANRFAKRSRSAGSVRNSVASAEKIYIVHGWAYNISKWQPFLKLLKAQGFKPKLLKIPGLTSSLKKAWKLSDYVNWLKQELKSESRPAVLLGHSNGGRICLAFAAKYPQKVNKLILIDSAGIKRQEIYHQVKRLVFKTIAKLGRKLTRAQYLRRLLYKLARESDYQKANPVMRQTMKNLITTDLTSSLKNIKVPTTIIWGQRDKITPLKHGQLMRQQIKNAKLYTIQQAKHSPHFTHPQDVAEIIKSELL